jgi:SAM-dependent methyltransferase
MTAVVHESPTAEAGAVAGSDAAWPAMVEAASRPYRRAGRYAWHFARAKLGADPVFEHLLQHGLIAPRARVLDLGCGQGLLASLLRVAGATARAGGWPPGWAAAPIDARITGIERVARDVARADTALQGAARFVHADMREAPFPASDAVVILDALHYISLAQQDRVLARVRAALGDGGALVLRVGDPAARRAFALSRVIDRLVMGLRGGGWGPIVGRPIARWIDALRALGFEVEAPVPMGAGISFANVLLVARAGALPRA